MHTRSPPHKRHAPDSRTRGATQVDQIGRQCTTVRAQPQPQPIPSLEEQQSGELSQQTSAFEAGELVCQSQEICSHLPPLPRKRVHIPGCRPYGYVDPRRQQFGKLRQAGNED
ncbi:hypothetical protein Ciccas_010658 [Cichlidogyrus casuarinus]|uniref:Uncharacterized protein n=1 Tax=Cichlidogyrus casuarinus TaxID=1844966 RepID=A0ABD2PTH8_9PLAT